MKEIRVIQGSPEWWSLRAGIPTASEFGSIITPAKGDYASAAETYASRLVAEALGWRTDFQGTPDTERGAYFEAKAREWLNYKHNLGIRSCGFFMDDAETYGASPDGMTPDECPVEIKCPDLHTFCEWKARGELPLKHKAQVHGEMWVTNAPRCVFLAYPSDEQAMAKVEPLMLTIERDDFTERLGKHLATFVARLAETQARIIRPAQLDAVRAALATGREQAIAKVAADRAEILARRRKTPPCQPSCSTPAGALCRFNPL